MADLVDREEVLEVIFNIMTDNKFRHKHRALNRNIKQLAVKTTNTERHAHWEQPSYFDEENGVFQCSNCKEEFVLISGSPKENEYEYCPHCGCKMDEVKENNGYAPF